MANSNSLFYRLMSSLTYAQKYGLMLILFVVTVAPLFVSMYNNYSTELNRTIVKIQWNKYQEPIQKILQNVYAHRFAAIQYLMGDKGQIDEITRTQNNVNQAIQQLKDLNSELLKVQTEQNFQFNIRKNQVLEEIQRNWQQLIEQFPNLTIEELDAKEAEVIRLAKVLLGDVHFTTVQYMSPANPSYYLMTNNQTLMPDAQDSLSSLLTTGELTIKGHPLTTKERDQMFSLIGVVTSMTSAIKTNINKSYVIAAEYGVDQEMRRVLDPLFSDYLQSVQEFIDFIQDQMMRKETTASANEFISRGQAAIDKGFKLWLTEIDVSDRFLTDKQRALTRNFYTYFFTMLFLICSAVALGFWIAIDASRRLAIANRAAEALAKGQLSERIPITYLDEVGRFSLAFNKMADTIETNIVHLKNLQQATKELADGNMGYRLSLEDDSEEFYEVAKSFNKMAETFEHITQQLKQVGINLSSTAAEIDIASKQQETVINNQEITTKAIAVTANDISTNAKAFANTISQVNRVAEDTSKLANEGKSGLSQMESVMRQMVDASGSIASRLSVLNEKTRNITSIMTTITKVADQTDLLSLNASIEAEKAGEYGRSFSVIAREIRRLAEQTAVATLDIEKIVNEIIAAVSSSVMGVDDFAQEIRGGVQQIRRVGETLSKIIEQVQNLTKRFEDVNRGMQQQSTNAEEIKNAINQLSHTAQQTSESIHQFRNTVEELDLATKDLRTVVAQITKKKS